MLKLFKDNPEAILKLNDMLKARGASEDNIMDIAAALNVPWKGVAFKTVHRAVMKEIHPDHAHGSDLGSKLSDARKELFITFYESISKIREDGKYGQTLLGYNSKSITPRRVRRIVPNSPSSSKKNIVRPSPVTPKTKDIVEGKYAPTQLSDIFDTVRKNDLNNNESLSYLCDKFNTQSLDEKQTKLYALAVASFLSASPAEVGLAYRLLDRGKLQDYKHLSDTLFRLKK